MPPATEVVWHVWSVRNRLNEKGGALEMSTGKPKWEVCMSADLFPYVVEGNGKTFEEAYMAAHDAALEAVAKFYNDGGVLPSRKED